MMTEDFLDRTPYRFRHFHTIAKSNYYFRRVCLSVCPTVRPHGTTRLPLDRFDIAVCFENLFRKTKFH
jgi:hypothetical protein